MRKLYEFFKVLQFQKRIVAEATILYEEIRGCKNVSQIVTMNYE